MLRNNMANEKQIKVPDIGGATNVDVIEVLIKVGDEVAKEDSLVTLESDKASMEIPSPAAGKISKVLMKVGDKVSEGDVIVLLEENNTDSNQKPALVEQEPTPVKEEQQPMQAEVVSEKTPTSAPAPIIEQESTEEESGIAAGPAVRRLARELGVNLEQVAGTGRKSRILKEDIEAYVKARLSQSPATSAFNVPAAPVIDFSKFGAIETKPLNKIKKLTGVNVHRAWVSIPHVTQFDEADITDLERFRKSELPRAAKEGYKLTLLAFVCSVVCKALRVFPQFNASLDASGENLIYKNYFNIGIAVETPNGLVVPVIQNVAQLNVSEIAKEMARLSTKAREKGLMPADMAGGCFTISSLGGIGGTAFTPIVNAPEVAILGLSRSLIKPVYNGDEFTPRLILPLSLSYDHRVIDGAEAARFTRFIAEHLGDIRRIVL